MWYCSLHKTYLDNKTVYTKCIEKRGKYKRSKHNKNCNYLIKLERKLEE